MFYLGFLFIMLIIIIKLIIRKFIKKKIFIICEVVYKLVFWIYIVGGGWVGR